MATQNSSNKLIYPTGLTIGDTDFIHIQVLKYIPPGTTSTSDAFNFRTGDEANRLASGGQNTRSLGNIFLPIPNNINDRNSVSWRESSLNSLALDAIEQAGGFIKDFSLDTSLQESMDAAGERVTKLVDKYRKGITDPKIIDNLETFLIGKGINVAGSNIDPQDLISRRSGAVLNPNMELLFKSVNLRAFTYTFVLTPRTRDESQTVKAIIRTFKRRMAPKSQASVDGGSGLFISAPDVFQLDFKRGSQDHPFLHDHKICALTDMQVNYTGTGAYATYDDATPVQINVTLNFNELSPVYAEDYKDLTDNDGVGF